MLTSVVFGAGCFNSSTVPDPALTKTKTVDSPVTALPSEIVIFVSNTCPHCAIIESLVKNGRMDKALPIEFKEVDEDDANLRLMVEKAKICGYDVSRLGVPLLWNGSRCYDGQDNIQIYLEQLMKLYEKNR